MFRLNLSLHKPQTYFGEQWQVHVTACCICENWPLTFLLIWAVTLTPQVQEGSTTSPRSLKSMTQEASPPDNWTLSSDSESCTHRHQLDVGRNDTQEPIVWCRQSQTPGHQLKSITGIAYEHNVISIAERSIGQQ